MKLLINYDYQNYPYTTASYIEDCARRTPSVDVSRLPCLPEEAEAYYTEHIEEKPDLLLSIMPVSYIPAIPDVPSAYWEIDNHLVLGKKKHFYKVCDVVYVPQQPFLHLYPVGKTKMLPLGAEPNVHYFIPPDGEEYDIGFVGNDTYPQRSSLLDSLARKYKVLRTQTKPGLPYSKALSSCKIIFNCSLNKDVNMRFFEAMSIGRLLLTDYLPQQDQYATVGKHYDIFENEADLHFKVEKYLKDEKARETMQILAKNNILERHTYMHRLLQILKDFEWIQS